MTCPITVLFRLAAWSPMALVAEHGAVSGPRLKNRYSLDVGNRIVRFPQRRSQRCFGTAFLCYEQLEGAQDERRPIFCESSQRTSALTSFVTCLKRLRRRSLPSKRRGRRCWCAALLSVPAAPSHPVHVFIHSLVVAPLSSVAGGATLGCASCPAGLQPP